MVDILNSKRQIRNAQSSGVIGRCAAIGPSGPVIYEVIDWPYAADVNGIPFDQASLYGVRAPATRDAAGTGETQYTSLTPVPRVLPSGYTVAPRRSFDYNPFGWYQRTANDRILRIKYGWNNYGYDQTAMFSNISGSPSGGIVTAGAYSGREYSNAAVGFFNGWRGGTYSIDVFNRYGVGAGKGCSVSVTLAMDADPSNPWAPPGGGVSPTGVSSISGSSNGDGSTKTSTGTLGFVAAPGGLGSFGGLYFIGDVAGSDAYWIINIKLGYRVDIPLCCDAVYQNKIAPGGYLP